MAVRDAGEFLRPAINSMLTQSMSDLELIVVDDGSTDGSSQTLGSYRDPRMRVLTQQPAGLVNALNAGLKWCEGEYVARMDADDISMPNRLAMQVAFLERNRDHVLVASRYEVIDEGGTVVASPPNPTEDDVLRLVLPTINTFGHGSVLMRRSALVSLGGYRDRFPVEDYDLWLRMMEKGKLASLEDVLYLWRKHPAGVSSDRRETQIAATTALSRQAISAEIASRNLPSTSKTSAISKDLRPLVAMAYRAYAYELLAAKQRWPSVRLLASSVRMSPAGSRHSATRLALMLASLVMPRLLRTIPAREYP